MKAKSSIRTSIRLFAGVTSALLASSLFGQTQINLSSQSRNADFTNFPYTRPFKTGTTLPSTCSMGDVFFNTTAVTGQNLFTCTATNTWKQQGGLQDPGSPGLVKRGAGGNTTTVVPAPSSAIVGVDDAQTLTNKSIDASEITSGVISNARIPSLTGDVTTAANSTLTTLATVNSVPGTYGDATHALQLTVDSKGRVTGVNSMAIAQSSVNSSPGTYGSATQIPVITVNAYGQITGVSTASASGGLSASAGMMSSIPSSCSAGSLYLATDQPLGQQLYTCSSANSWTATVSVGPSGALAISSGSIDIVTSVVPRLMSANTFTGLNTFSAGIKLNSGSSQPACDSSIRGSLWFQNNGSSRDSLQVCAYSGTAYNWVSIY